MPSAKILFITGTDTGVGKTLLTRLLLQNLRMRGINALAMKPFCSGGMEDVDAIQELQPGCLSDREMNPFFFQNPVAPLVESLEKHRKIRLKEVLKAIRAIAKRCDLLLVEGSGGLMVPLGEKYDVGDLIAALECEVIIVSRNQLGTINHTLLTLKALQTLGISKKMIQVVMMTCAEGDVSASTNQMMIERMESKIKVSKLPFLEKTSQEKKKF